MTTILDMRYIGQSYELMIPCDLHDSARGTLLEQWFHETHRKKFSHADESAPIEIINLRVQALGRRPPFSLPKLGKGETEPPLTALSGRRQVYFGTMFLGESEDWYETPVWKWEFLLARNQISGPAVIEELSSTALLHPSDRGTVDAFGNLLVTLD